MDSYLLFELTYVFYRVRLAIIHGECWVCFLKELIEFVLSPSNHLIDIDPKLDGNTLHIKASS